MLVTGVLLALFLCVLAAVSVLVAVALPELRGDPDVVSRSEHAVRRAKVACSPLRSVILRARDVAEDLAGKVADCTAGLTARASRVRR